MNSRIALLFVSASAAEKPNIVYILFDVMGYADVGFNGNKDFLTPNIDKLAKKGTALKDKGILDNTLIIYSSDNGGPNWNGATQNTDSFL